MKNILIVDDNKINLSSARMVLKDDYKVTAVMKGTQALAYLEKSPCDIVLLDINMPEMDGFEVLKKIRELPQGENIPVIFLTADSDSDTETKCFREGAVDFIVKPFVPEVMRSRISRTLELEELRQSLAVKLEQKTQEVTDIKSKSHKDALTGLWNRNYTEETVDRMLAEGTCGALMMIDMDNFKAINDNYGHIAGDQTLKMFAETLCKYANEEDVLCRIGGDEFVVFIKDVSSKSIIGNRASDIISDLCKKLEACKFETNSSVSIGIAQCPDDGTDFAKLYNAADKALYYVKQNGKNAYHFFSDQKEAENDRAGKAVDLAYLREFMNRTDSGRGAYLLDFDSFHNVYNFIRRFIERSNRDVQTVLFTLAEQNTQDLDVTEVELAMDLLEKAIYKSLRRSDVSTRYSSKQIIVILMDSDSENGDTVAKRIIECFCKLYTGNHVTIDYGIAQMDGSSLFGKKALDVE